MAASSQIFCCENDAVLICSGAHLLGERSYGEMSMSFRLTIGLLVLVALLFPAASFAQSERGTITGTVQDSSGAVIPAAKVVLTNTQNGVSFTTNTNDSGDYTVPQLQVGT